jgi:hypothetical protein
MFLAPVYFFGAKVGTSSSRQNVTISKNKKHRIFRNVKFHPVRKFRDIPNTTERYSTLAEFRVFYGHRDRV